MSAPNSRELAAFSVPAAAQSDSAPAQPSLESSSTASGADSAETRLGFGTRILEVPLRLVNAHMDIKFQSDPYGMDLHGLMSEAEYTDTVDRLNDTIKPARSTAFDAALLGFMILPWWGVRRRRHTRQRKRLLMGFIDDFNSRNPHLHMRWHRRPTSKLTIEHKPANLREADRL